LCTGSIRKQFHLLFLDPILHLAPSAVQLLVQRLLFPTAGTERGHHETGIFPLRQIFRLAHYTALSTPTLASPVLKVGKDSGGFSPLFILSSGFCHRLLQSTLQPFVLGQSED